MEVQQQQVTFYESTDRETIINLLALGHRPRKVEIDTFQTNTLRYFFSQTDVAEHLEVMITSPSSQIMVPISAFWEAEDLWKRNLRHFFGDRRQRA